MTAFQITILETETEKYLVDKVGQFLSEVICGREFELLMTIVVVTGQSLSNDSGIWMSSTSSKVDSTGSVSLFGFLI